MWRCKHVTVLSFALGWLYEGTSDLNSRTKLRPGDVHIVDGFLSSDDLKEVSNILHSSNLQEETKYGTKFNSVHPTESASAFLWSIIQRIRNHAEENLISESQLRGSWEYRGQYFPDLFTLRRYGAMKEMKVHMDTGSHARCLSATLHVGSSAGNSSDSTSTHNYGGSLQTYRCKGRCKQWHGWMNRNTQQPPEDLRELKDSEYLLQDEAHYKPGRLVFFLAETPHGVTSVSDGGERDVLFVWHSCEATLTNGASSSGHVELVKFLIDSKASIDSLDPHGQAPLAHAAASGHVRMTKYLSMMRAGIDKIDARGLQPIHVAAMWGHLPVVQHLIELNVPLTAQTLDGYTPIELAVLGGRATFVDDIMNTTMDNDRRHYSCAKLMQTCIRAGHATIANLLLHRHECDGVINDVDEDAKRPLFWASWTGHVRIAELLLSARAQVDSVSTHEGKRMQALDVATANGHDGIVRLLLNAAPLSEASLAEVRVLAQKHGHRRLVGTMEEFRVDHAEL